MKVVVICIIVFVFVVLIDVDVLVVDTSRVQIFRGKGSVFLGSGD